MGGAAAARPSGAGVHGDSEVIDLDDAPGFLPRVDVDARGQFFVVRPLPGPWQRAKVRAFDLAVATMAAVLLSPLMAAIALVVKLTSRGPVLFRQERLGRSGRPFICLKFRTMTDGADRQLAALLRDNPGLSEEFRECFKLRDDPRVTRVGRWARATSLDELPQLFNVLMGHMSIVGPRPIVEAERTRYGHHLPLVLTVKPGMTGLWQVNGRTDISYAHRIRYDVEYAQERNLSTDFQVCLQTPRVLLRRLGAY